MDRNRHKHRYRRIQSLESHRARGGRAGGFPPASELATDSLARLHWLALRECRSLLAACKQRQRCVQTAC